MPLDGEQLDWTNPDYAFVFRRRLEALERLRAASPREVAGLKLFYKDHPDRFITDWGCTFDPRNVADGRPVLLPFVLFPRQVECVDYLLRKWRNKEPGLVEKSRDMGFTWLAVALSCTMCLFHDGMRIGFGSRKEEYVDKLGEPKSILQKGREFMRLLPREFRGGWTLKDHAPHMRLMFPETGATIGGEAGDNIGRGDRTTWYFVDEAAHLEPRVALMVEAALSQTTNCRIDASSVNGMANMFAQKRHSGKIECFVFDWRDDPRKDQAWYDTKKEQSIDPTIFAQEVDRDYAAAVEGVIIPNDWVQSAVDAHVKLNIKITGERFAALDVADEGRDLNALCGGHGILVDVLEEWSGKGSDLFATAQRAFDLCDEHGYTRLRYDADGLGVGIRGDATQINARRRQQQRPILTLEPFQGSGAVVDPEGKVNPDAVGVDDRTNEDFFQNYKAQSWWGLRRRFYLTHKAVTQGGRFRADDLISISSRMPRYRKLVTELSQPTRTFSGATGKMVVDKTPEGAQSPNLADAVNMRFAASSRPAMRLDPAQVARI